ncbi:MAG: hypothetical protein ACIAQ0_12875 [Phycisphaerales bacterium JB058]
MTDQTTDTSAKQTTKLARKWVMKMALFLVLLFGFGLYGLYDATMAYPNRGEDSASWHLHQYLAKSDEANSLTGDLGIPSGTTAAEHMADLESRLGELTQSAGGTSIRARDDAALIAKYAWLKSLSVLGRLSDERVASDLATPRETYNELNEKWTSADQPKPLASYDIPVQWLFTIIGFGGGLWMLIHILAVASKKYTWEPAALRLGVPGGATIVPGDVEVFDRRKWDKFLVFLKIKPEHPQLGGKEIKLDLYQYEPLEAWYEQMHRAARPEDFAEDDAEQAQAEQQDSAESEEETSATQS